MMMWCLAAMATPPSVVGTPRALPFKVKSEKTVTNTVPTNLVYCKDVTPKWLDDQLARKGITVTRSMGFPQTPDGRIYPAQSPLREGEQTYTLTVNLKYDKDEVMRLSNGTAFPNPMIDHWYFNEYPDTEQPDAIDFLLPAGSYDIEVQLETMDGYIILLAPETIVEGDREITLDAADATVEINWTALLPDGGKAHGDIYRYDPETFEVLEEIPGNCLDLTHCLDITNTKHGIGSSIMGGEITAIVGDTEMTIGAGNVRIMPSNDYLLSRNTHVTGMDGGYVIALVSDALQSADLSNNTENYKVIKPEFVYTPYQPEPQIFGEGDDQVIFEFDKDKAFSLVSYDVKSGLLTGIGSTTLTGPEYERRWIYVCQDPSNIDRYQVMPVPTVVEDWDYKNVGLPVNTEAYPYHVVAINNSENFGPYMNLPEDRNIYFNRIENPWLSFDVDKPHVWNYGCPTQVFRTAAADWGESFSFSYIGRLGERREVDQLATVGYVSVNDEAPSDEVLENLQYGQLPQEGKINFEFTDSNVMIDNIAGKNVSKLEFDMEREDWCPPTLQIVRFIDTDGNFTDRYPEGKDGVIEFYGGDFICHNNPETWISWYTEVPASEVSVEYAPYNTNDFLPLEVENIPEQDFMPGFGSFYRGSLASVDRPSENGWFDVRIRLTDASGNYQEQTLSPAFWIEANVGVNEVAGSEIGVAVANGRITVCGCENPTIEVYSTDGMLLRRASATSLDATAFGSGIYLVSVTDGSARVVRKVRL